MNNYIKKMYTKKVCNISSGRNGVCLLVITGGFEISILNLTHKVPLNTSYEIRKSLKRMLSLVYTEIDQTKYRISSMFAFICIFGHC